MGQGRGYGVGDMTQYYGTAPSQLPVPSFGLNLVRADCREFLTSFRSRRASANHVHSIPLRPRAVLKLDWRHHKQAAAWRPGGGGGGLGGILSGIGGLFGFADGGLINGAGSGTSDSNLALVSDGEYIVNAGATAKNKALLTAINSGRAPKFGASLPSGSNVVNSRSNSASTTHNHYTVNNNISTPNADSFRKSSRQIMSDASVHLQRMGVRNG